MKRNFFVIMTVILIISFSGCGRRAATKETGDFTFSLPDGYQTVNVQNWNCDIQNPEGRTVGGIRLTKLRPQDVLDSSSTPLMGYLDHVGGNNMGSEYITMTTDEEKLPLVVSNRLTDGEKSAEYTRLFLIKEGVVYDLFLDKSLVSEEDQAMIQKSVLTDKSKILIPDTNLVFTELSGDGCSILKGDTPVGELFEIALEPEKICVHGDMDDLEWFQLLKMPMEGMTAGDYDYMCSSGLEKGTVVITFFHPDFGEFTHYIFPWKDRSFDLCIFPDCISPQEEHAVSNFVLTKIPKK